MALFNQDLSKYLEKYDSQVANDDSLESLKGLSFYSDWSGGLKPAKQAQTDFNHAIGLPQKNGQSYPLFDYEQLLFNELQNHKHIWIKKATGLGVTEFMLRYMAWLCLRDDTYRNATMPIVCGPNQDIAIKLIKRIKNMFEPLGVLFDTKETVVELNGCTIEAYPSNHLDAYRSLENPKFIFLDEADFFRPSDQQDARDVSERYIAKSRPWIVMVSTPNAPEGLFERIEKEPESTCLYRRLFLDYTYGLDKIYTEQEIAEARRSPSFEREYNLKYLGLIGNVFHTKDIEAAIERGRHLLPESGNNAYTQKSVGLDPGFGSSAFGVCITELIDGMVNVLHAEEYPRPDFNEMIETTIQLLLKYNITFEGRSRIFVDGANPSFIRALKARVSEDDDYENMIAHLKTSYGSNFGLHSLIYNMFVVPIAFNTQHRNMLAYAKKLMEYGSGVVAINPSHTKLITALRTAVEKGEGTLDKEATSHDDLFDAFRMSLQYWVSN
jgi:hypothetical protein